jgi:hypothetical protein
MEPFIRRDIASLKPPPGWSAIWRPDYERNGTSSGVQIYDLKLEGNTAVVLCLVGNTRSETRRWSDPPGVGRLAYSRYLDQNFDRMETPGA